jgi:hypothetical protein
MPRAPRHAGLRLYGTFQTGSRCDTWQNGTGGGELATLSLIRLWLIRLLSILGALKCDAVFPGHTVCRADEFVDIVT